MSTKDTSYASAFPVNTSNEGAAGAYMPEPGMTIRQYAAIKLRVPDSGEEWLDDMIRQSLRDEFAGKAMQGIVSATAVVAGDYTDVARWAYEYADAMLKARTYAQDAQ